MVTVWRILSLAPVATRDVHSLVSVWENYEEVGNVLFFFSLLLLQYDHVKLDHQRNQSIGYGNEDENKDENKNEEITSGPIIACGSETVLIISLATSNTSRPVNR